MLNLWHRGCLLARSMSPAEARTRAILALPCVLLSKPTFAEVLRETGERAIQPVPACETLRKGKRFNVLFDRVDVDKLVQTAADVTCRTFIVPDNIKGKISIIGPDQGHGNVSAEEFYSAFLAALDANGMTVVRSGSFFRIPRSRRRTSQRSKPWWIRTRSIPMRKW